MAEESERKEGFTLSPEIEKYIESLSKDPKSRVFAPLAEAYRKGGLLDEAIQVAQDGLKFNPGYVSGRMALGRAYYDKGMKSEAREELEKVVKSAPDNIMAHKILGEIYQGEGRAGEAVKSFKIVLALNPTDKEVSEALDILEGRKPPPSVPAKPAVAPPVKKEEVKAEPERVAPKVAEAPQPRVEVSPPERAEEVKASPPVGGEEVVGEEEELSAVVGEAGESQKEAESFDGLEETFKEFEEIPPEKAEEVQMKEEAESAPAGKPEALRAEVRDEIPRKEPLGQAQVASSESGMEMEAEPLGEPEIAETEANQVQPEAGREELATVTMAELYNKQGYPEKALKVYQDILTSDPDNLEIKKRIEELSGQTKPPPSPENQLEKRAEGNIRSLSMWLDKVKKGG
jgi:tetratricopeptide (TPR) repeat protein